MKGKKMDKSSSGKSYSKETLRHAVRDILNCQLTVQDASRQHNIPQRTLQHYVKYGFSTMIYILKFVFRYVVHIIVI